MATLYLPLRSNARWFRDEATHAAFEARLKTCLVLYDKLFIQDGRYELTFWQDGQHLEWLIPPHMLGGVERRHRFAETGAPMGISLAPKGGNFTPIISGPIESWLSFAKTPSDLTRRISTPSEYIDEL